MIFSLFRNGKECIDNEWYRTEVTEVFAMFGPYFIEREIWEKFMHKHLQYGGIIHNRIEFIEEAKKMGFSIEEVIA